MAGCMYRRVKRRLAHIQSMVARYVSTLEEAPCVHTEYGRAACGGEEQGVGAHTEYGRTVCINVGRGALRTYRVWSRSGLIHGSIYAAYSRAYIYGKIKKGQQIAAAASAHSPIKEEPELWGKTLIEKLLKAQQ